MRNCTIFFCLCCFALLLASICETAEMPGNVYAYKQSYRGLNIEIEGIFLTTDWSTGEMIANIPIRIKNKTGKAFSFESQKMDCNGKEVKSDVVDEYIGGEIESGTCKEDVITVEINEKSKESVDELVFTYKIQELNTDKSKCFSIKERFSEG